MFPTTTGKRDPSGGCDLDPQELESGPALDHRSEALNKNVKWKQ